MSSSVKANDFGEDTYWNTTSRTRSKTRRNPTGSLSPNSRQPDFSGQKLLERQEQGNEAEHQEQVMRKVYNKETNQNIRNKAIEFNFYNKETNQNIRNKAIEFNFYNKETKQNVRNKKRSKTSGTRQEEFLQQGNEAKRQEQGNQI
jgi:hypothetical protein